MRNRIQITAAEKMDMCSIKPDTRSNLLFFKRKLLEFVALAVSAAIILQAPFIDVLILKNTITETSLTELLQGSILTMIAGIFIYLSRHHPVPGTKYGMVLIAGFFSCAVIRELDFITDQLHISWFYFVLAIVSYMIFLAWRHPDILDGVVDFCKSESYYIMLCGLLTVFVFSRLMGMGLLWQNLLNESYLRVVKNAMEEGTELFGYTLCLISALKYTVSLSGRKEY
ncbi:hypothetical protein [Acetonema longum]|uniref:Uncharacterized protein n=1 Tax=Acetonema longum DSM 6540 TaxID=1009370 RepID=F7NEF2_9FIRM|nr:hypothetical protein [Acetonema longum]EGO65363.1 hypothetical protein ALO_02076 [Acetonema longum DSM 6540]